MASGSSRRNRRTGGIVQYSTNAYGFIELNNKDLPISTVFFDRSSFDGDRNVNVSKVFPKGTNVTLTFVLTDGEHKVKHKAINLMKQGVEKQKSHDGGQKHHRQSQEKQPRSGDSYLKKYLAENGAMELDKLVQDLGRRSDNCPKFLRSANIDEIVNLANQHPTLFEIKHGFLCLCEMENEIIDALSVKVATPANISALWKLFPLNKVSQPGIYLYGRGPGVDGARDFFVRNPERFILWDNTMYDKGRLFQDPQLRSNYRNELKAVKYYSEFVIAKGSLSIASLSGHFNQASEDIKKVVAPKHEDFHKFVVRNSIFFDVSAGTGHACVIVSCSPNKIAVIDRVLLKTRQRQRKGGQQKQGNTDDPFRKPRSEENISKAFNEFGFDSPNPKNPYQCSDASDSFSALYSFQARAVAEPGLQQAQFSGKTQKKQKIYGSSEARAFRDVVGGDLAQAIESEVLAVGGSSLNDVVLVRFNVGKKPTVKIFTNDVSVNRPLDQTKEIDVEDLQKMVRHKLIVKSGVLSHYGIKETLHSLRTIEQGGKISGLTLLCQLHCESDGLGIDIIRRKRLTAVLSDPGARPLKFVYNYLRSRCKELAQANDVLVLDVDGQLSGCDDQPHSSLGDVTRIGCRSSSELQERINTAIQHMHEYVIVIGVESVEVLQTIHKMCGKGIEVIAEMPIDLKNEVESLFSS